MFGMQERHCELEGPVQVKQDESQLTHLGDKSGYEPVLH